ncbi:MAG: pyruvate dehydrogenase E2 component (dihydrolipoamide acetyltransferase) [Ilumatobacter sp.]|jgi:pyruvate dehydrogenase E2 component (dihydrolipoamide acetyltransferase)
MDGSVGPVDQLNAPSQRNYARPPLEEFNPMADITLPQLGETVTEGTILQWFKSVGDSVAADEPLFEVSTDKVDTEVPSPISGVLTEIRVEEGETVDVGTVIAIVGSADDVSDSVPIAEPATDSAAELPSPDSGALASPVSPPRVVDAVPARSREGGKLLLSPVVRRLVSEHGLTVDAILGTGPGGRITRDDVLGHLDVAAADAAPVPTPAVPTPAAPTPAAPTPAAPKASPVSDSVGQRDRSLPLSTIRQRTGDHMIMSRATSPHAFSMVEVDYSNVNLVRSSVTDKWNTEYGFSLTYLPFIARAVIDALGQFPHLNASVGDGELVVHKYIDLGIAIDLDYEGLLAPVVRDAETKRLAAIAREVHHLADRARRGALSPDEISGGTFTLSNNGSAGSVLTMPIINQPQVGIISTDAVVRKPVVVTDRHGDEAIAIHPVGNLAMSWDHRAFDGAYAAGFLKRVKEILETKDWSTEL